MYDLVDDIVMNLDENIDDIVTPFIDFDFDNLIDDETSFSS